MMMIIIGVVMIIIQVVGPQYIRIFYTKKANRFSRILEMGRNNKQKHTNQAKFELFEIVWTKICGYPWWPSKITDILTVDATKIPEGDLSRIKLNGKAILSSKFIKPKPKTPSKLPTPIEQKTIYKVQFIGETTYSLLESTDIQNYCENWEKHSSPKISKISQGFYEARRIADTIMGLLKLESEISDEQSDKLRHDKKNKAQKQTKEKHSTKKDKQSSNHKPQITRKNSQLVPQAVADEKKVDNNPVQNGGQENEKQKKLDNRKMTNFRELNNLNLDSIIVENNRRRLVQPPTPKLQPKVLQKQQSSAPNVLRNLRSSDKKSQKSEKPEQQIYEGEPSALEQQPSPYQQKPQNQIIIKADSCFHLSEEQLERKYNLHLITKRFDQLRTKKYGNLLQNNSDRRNEMKKKMILKIDAILKAKFIDIGEINRRQSTKMAEVLAHEALKGKDVTDAKYHREYIRFFNRLGKATASQILEMYRESSREPLKDNTIEKAELQMKSSEIEARGI